MIKEKKAKPAYWEWFWQFNGSYNYYYDKENSYALKGGDSEKQTTLRSVISAVAGAVGAIVYWVMAVQFWRAFPGRMLPWVTLYMLFAGVTEVVFGYIRYRLYQGYDIIEPIAEVEGKIKKKTRRKRVWCIAAIAVGICVDVIIGILWQSNNIS